jgi:hypothetical protein
LTVNKKYKNLFIACVNRSFDARVFGRWCGGGYFEMTKVAGMENNQKIIGIAKTSLIRSYKWKDRGVAPIGYTVGMALCYADACDRLRGGDRYAQAIAAPLMHDAEHDVLDWYADILGKAGLSVETPADRLTAVFAILLGLGMRESSGKYCEGRYRKAHNTQADTAEAGLFQVSFDSSGAHSLLRPLFAEYSGRDDLLSVFQAGVNCDGDDLENWGEGEGRDFQALTKSCPQFAVLYAAILLRRRRQHWGPFKKYKVEVPDGTVGLLRTIREAVSNA